MLHILLLILKIIGIILAVILGIVVLLMCIVLFVPVRYEVHAACNGNMDSLKIKVTVTWLFHLIRGDIYYKKRKLMWRLRAAWIKRMKGQIKEEIKHEETGPFGMEEERKEHEDAEKIPEKEEEISKGGEESREESQKGQEKSFEESEYKEADEGTSHKEETLEKRKTLFEKINDLLEKIKAFFRKIKDGFLSFYNKIKMLLEKKDRLVDFITDEIHKGAAKKAAGELLHLLKRLNPRKLTADIHFGFEDPCITGKVLAGLGILYPFLSEHVNVVPDFENRVFEGEIDIKGKVHGYYFFILCFNLLWCKDVRTTYKHIKNFEL